MVIVHVTYMTEQALVPWHQYGKHAKHADPGYNLSVSNVISPGNTQQPSQVAQMEGSQLTLLTMIKGPCSALREETAQHTDL